jgi:hypothetical protein
MVMLSCVIFVPAGHPVDAVLARLPLAAPSTGIAAPALLNGIITTALIAYALLLPLVKVGQYVNLLLRRRFPGPAQRALDRYANVFGIIVWRVFSADHTNFFARIGLEDPTTRRRSPLARPGRVDMATGLRFVHVGEFITLVSIFTTAKYFPSRPELLHERLLRYARTLRRPGSGRIVFEYVVLAKSARAFEERTIAEFTVDVETGRVVETTLDPEASVRAPSPVSPIHEAARPGTYQPLHPTRVGDL